MMRRVPKSLQNGHLHAALNNSGGDGVAGEAGGIVDVELFHEALPVLFDGQRAGM